MAACGAWRPTLSSSPSPPCGSAVKVVLAQSAGFCFGVRRAVEKSLAVASAAPGPVFTDGPLIHNPGMLAELGRHGVRVAENPEDLPPDATLIVRAHGIPPERRTRLLAAVPRLVDATCPEVARIQGLIRSRVARGRDILILGDAGHAEVVGLLGHAQGHGRVVSSPDEVAALPEALGPVTLVSQSTQDEETFAAVAAAVRERFPDAEVLDTICAATKNRQGELRSLAGAVDAIVVVGDRSSANSRRLAEIASRLRPTFLVRNADDIRPADFADARAIGLTAGASTPDDTIQTVLRRLQSLPSPSDPPATEPAS